jgi:hypothetical protein
MGAIERSSLYDLIKATKMCSVPNMVIPKKFRVLEFVKYTGTQCLVTLFKAYCNKMTEVVNDEKLLIHFFQDSLSDVALTWYMWLDNTKVKSGRIWLMPLLGNISLIWMWAPNRSSLQAMKKDNKESIR